MARKPRVVVAGMPLHIIQRGNNRQAVFFAAEDYQRYLDDLYDASVKHDCQIHAYVLMTNHVHLLVTPGRVESAAKMMQTLGRCYVSYINKVYQRTGTLWEGRYKSALVDSEQYFLTCSRYIELNPVRANMVKTPEKYRWSSYPYNALGQDNKRITPHECYRRLGSDKTRRCEAYRKLFDVHIDQESLTLIRKNTEQNNLIGNERFRIQIEQALNRKLHFQAHGGDRKSDNYKKKNSKIIFFQSDEYNHQLSTPITQRE